MQPIGTLGAGTARGSSAARRARGAAGRRAGIELTLSGQASARSNVELEAIIAANQ